MTQTPADPIRYAPDIETIAADEAETLQGLKDTFRQILDKTSKDYGHAVRSVHAKGHALVRGTLSVHDGLPPQFAQGMFAAPGTYDAVLRNSTAPGDLLPDSVSSPRGMALKVIGVAGERLPGSEGDTTQDFLLVNGPAFGAPEPKAFLKNLKLLAKTTDTGEGWKEVLSATLRTIEGALESLGGASATLQTLGGVPEVHPLGETYYSQTPFRYGDFIAKFSLKPVSSGLTERTGDHVNTHDRPDALREDLNEVLIEQGGTWDLQVQLATDLEKMPVEDASVAWDERSVLSSPSRRSMCRRSRDGSMARAREAKTRCPSARGMAWPRTARSAGSIARARRPTNFPPAIAETSTNARSTSRHGPMPWREPSDGHAERGYPSLSPIPMLARAESASLETTG